MELLPDFLKIKRAKEILGQLSSSQRRDFLLDCADNLLSLKEEILNANAKDLQKAQENNLNASMCARLRLDSKKIEVMANSLREIANYKDPLNRVMEGFSNHCGLKIEKVSVPLGVVAIIYESRPNVTSDTAGLCFKSGNVAILKGGKEAQNSNEAIIQAFFGALKKHSLPQECITLLKSMQNREELKEILELEGLIDLVIPRGGEGLIKFVSTYAKMPVIKQDKGVCHIYAHKTCNQSQAIEIVINAKTSYPSACNACETLLIDREIAKEFLNKCALALKEKDVQLKGTKECCEVLNGCGILCEEIGESAFNNEYGENIINLKIVENLSEALVHISTFSSGHSEAILCEDYSIAEEFLNKVDSACVYVNASTRFSDGGEFGYGAEVGISTSKLHARGPMGVEALTSYKYKIRGDGQIRG
ncbi:glutamate-5-semialdehyde dehydrogenase [Helicobacter valdiviensis]|uniref:Gamma-glutamyl phosphate reductase n=1 Tax=Helicobacter valdiviensis TaxID=1458358 RepID=A0A2W6NNH8_9HELI|nr:glutamate-5-semialdehyde dehydrogenase [Helicobacter valdiviensis]PZT48996.1 glutamate-5-semialdehyde dehydrogenase [Helicobacter valdiviensis]